MKKITPFIISFILITVACRNNSTAIHQPSNSTTAQAVAIKDTISTSASFALKLSAAALNLTNDKVAYDPAYFSIQYPNGDVPADKGVCTDVVIRAYRKLGIDLQKAVHEDMAANFNIYPKIWGLKKTDTNIDHRRVPNLMTFFSRHGNKKPISQNKADYQPGDIVTWNLEGNLTHIGIVVNKLSDDKQRFLIVHNIGRGQELSDCLFEFAMTGHYSYGGK